MGLEVATDGLHEAQHLLVEHATEGRPQPLPASGLHRVGSFSPRTARASERMACAMSYSAFVALSTSGCAKLASMALPMRSTASSCVLESYPMVVVVPF